MRRGIERFGVVAVAVVAVAVPALAAPPANDRRADAQPISVPDTAEGTTREATRQSNDPSTGCAGSAGATVWYGFDAASDERVAVELTARTDDLEAIIAVYRRDRSTLEPLDCDVANRRGRASVLFRAMRGERYLIMVDQTFDSEPGDFTLETFVPEAEPTPPGPRLPRRGGVATVDRARDLTDAWSKHLRAGTSYVATLASSSDACPSFGIYQPGIGSFDAAAPLRSAPCNAHRLFTPDRSGRYSFLVRAGRGEQGPQRYRMRVRRAGRDDTAPGNVIANYERVRGHVGPRRADVVDLHRFYVRRRSDVELRFSSGGDVNVELRNVRGRFIDSGDAGLRRVLRRGRYYAVVRSGSGGGRYRLQPAVRAITRSFISINGRRQAVIVPGQAAQVAVGVAPAAAGRIAILVQRLDPLEGWQFHRRFLRQTSTGRAAAAFVPRRPGRFRARAIYSGSRLAAPSETGFAYVSAREPF